MLEACHSTTRKCRGDGLCWSSTHPHVGKLRWFRPWLAERLPAPGRAMGHWDWYLGYQVGQRCERDATRRRVSRRPPGKCESVGIGQRLSVTEKKTSVRGMGSAGRMGADASNVPFLAVRSRMRLRPGQEKNKPLAKKDKRSGTGGSLDSRSLAAWPLASCRSRAQTTTKFATATLATAPEARWGADVMDISAGRFRAPCIITSARQHFRGWNV